MSTTTLQPNAARDAGHTPGPWLTEAEYRDGSPLLIYAAGSVLIADLSRATNAERADNPGANAALIAASPDLLAALQSAVDLLTNLGNELQENIGEADYTPQFIPSVRNAALAAIAKAKGEQP